MIKYTGTIPQKMCYSTFLIESCPGGSGTGFFFKYYDSNNRSHNFLVSNKHVVCHESFKNLHGQIIVHFRMNNNGQPLHDYAYPLYLNTDQWEEMWFCHPSTDIAICNIDTVNSYIGDERSQLGGFFYTSIDKDIIPSKKDLDKLDLIEPVKFVGYPGGMYDKKNYMPIIRQGITATPLQLNYNHEEKFLIDASTFPGSSGSPVFLHRENTTPQLFYFIGVISDGLPPLENAIIDHYGVLPLKSKERLDIGIVIKAEMVVETIEQYLKEYSIIS